MKTTQIIGAILIVASLFLGYTGVTTISNNSASVELLGLEINASDESGKEKGYVYLGLAALLFAGGVYSMKK